jgi:hypothetical protein
VKQEVETTSRLANLKVTAWAKSNPTTASGHCDTNVENFEKSLGFLAFLPYNGLGVKNETLQDELLCRHALSDY